MLFWRIWGTLVPHSSVVGLSKKFSWFYIGFLQYKQIPSVSSQLVHIYNCKALYVMSDKRVHFIYMYTCTYMLRVIREFILSIFIHIYIFVEMIKDFIFIYIHKYICCEWQPSSFYIYVYIYIYEVHTISFQTFFVWAFKIVVDFWKFNMLLLYILWDDWPMFMMSCLNEQIQQQLEYTLLKPNCHSWWISKMQSGREDTLEEQYAIKFCFKLGKNATETFCFSTILHESSISFWVA